MYFEGSPDPLQVFACLFFQFKAQYKKSDLQNSNTCGKVINRLRSTTTSQNIKYMYISNERISIVMFCCIQHVSV